MGKVLGAAGDSMKESAAFGADYMRQAINEGSPTGSEWHRIKNSINGQAPGSRIGGTVEAIRGRYIFQADPTSGQMYDAVDAGPLKFGGTTAVINYGWVNTQQQYFLLQDTGGYIKTASGKGKMGVGMGLLNTAEAGGGKGTIRQLGAFNSTNHHFVELMKSKGFHVSGGK